MMIKAKIQEEMDRLIREYGEWSYNIPLGHNIWTKGNEHYPHTRLRRIVQIARDLAGKTLAECRVLDLGCLDGLFSLEFAMQGAETVGVEIREGHIKKCEFSRDVHGLKNLSFLHEDVKNINAKMNGEFDVVICSGVLYHLHEGDIPQFIENLFEVTGKVLIVDTKVSLQPQGSFDYQGQKFWGKEYREHENGSTLKEKSSNPLASWDNVTSFWLTRPSLVNLLATVGFTSVYENLFPVHINFGAPGPVMRDRCTFVAMKTAAPKIITSPRANQFHEMWPETSLTYHSADSWKI